MNKSVVCLSLLRPQYRRAYVKKIRPHNFTAGDSVLLTSDSVLFRNTEEHGLTSTLNVIRVVKEKVGRDLYKVEHGNQGIVLKEKVERDLYKVEHGNQGIVLFGSEMVPYTPSSSDSRDSTQSTSTSLLIESRLVLDKIAMYAICCEEEVQPKYDIKVVVKSTGYDFPVDDTADLTPLFYMAFDCGFMATLTEDEDWKECLENYHATLLHYVQKI